MWCTIPRPLERKQTWSQPQWNLGCSRDRQTIHNTFDKNYIIHSMVVSTGGQKHKDQRKGTSEWGLQYHIGESGWPFREDDKWGKPERWDRSFPGRGNSAGRGREAGVCLECLGNARDASGVETWLGQESREEVREPDPTGTSTPLWNGDHCRDLSRELSQSHQHFKFFLGRTVEGCHPNTSEKRWWHAVLRSQSQGETSNTSSLSIMFLVDCLKTNNLTVESIVNFNNTFYS